MKKCENLTVLGLLMMVGAMAFITSCSWEPPPGPTGNPDPTFTVTNMAGTWSVGSVETINSHYMILRSDGTLTQYYVLAGGSGHDPEEGAWTLSGTTLTIEGDNFDDPTETFDISWTGSEARIRSRIYYSDGHWYSPDASVNNL